MDEGREPAGTGRRGAVSDDALSDEIQGWQSLGFQGVEPTILLEDGPLLAVNKPAGLLTQGVPGGLPTLEAWVKAYLKSKYRKPGNVYLGIPHRLDRPVSGVMVFAKNSKAAARLAEQFRERTVRKWYLAVTHGVPDPPSGVLTDWLLKNAERAHALIVPPDVPGAKRCDLHYEVLSSRDDTALVRIELLTGRMHQIRAQFAARGWPIIGDVQYGASGEPGTSVTGDAIALHAERLDLKHPIRYDDLSLRAAMPANWAAYAFTCLESLP
jgi:23S rRNA pseudouridine1911/1915/1917 synthase